MKRISFILMLLLGTLAVSAQRGDGGQRGEKKGNREQVSPEEKQAKELAQLTKALDLTAEQILEVKAVQDKFTESMEKMRESMGENADRKQMREDMLLLKEQSNKDIEALLDDEQKVKYTAYLKEQEEKMKERGQGQGGQRKQGGGQRPS